MGIRDELCVQIAYVLRHAVAEGYVTIQGPTTLLSMLDELAQLDAESDAARALRAACALEQSRV